MANIPELLAQNRELGMRNAVLEGAIAVSRLPPWALLDPINELLSIIGELETICDANNVEISQELADRIAIGRRLK